MLYAITGQGRCRLDRSLAGVLSMLYAITGPVSAGLSPGRAVLRAGHDGYGRDGKGRVVGAWGRVIGVGAAPKAQRGWAAPQARGYVSL